MYMDTNLDLYKISESFAYSQVPIKRVGPNERVGWIFKYINFVKEYILRTK